MKQLDIFGEAELIVEMPKVKEKRKPKSKKEEESVLIPKGQTNIFDFIEELPHVGKIYGVKIQQPIGFYLASAKVQGVGEDRIVRFFLSYGENKNMETEWTLQEFWKLHKAYEKEFEAYRK